MEDSLQHCFQYLNQIYWKDLALVSKKLYCHCKSLIQPIKSYSEFNDACLEGRIEDIRLTLKVDPTMKTINSLFYAAYGGHIKLIKLLLNYGSRNWYFVIAGACRNNHLDVFEYFRPMIYNVNRNHWNKGLLSACVEGHLNVVERMIELGANDYKTGLEESCKYKQEHLVEFFIKQGTKRVKHKWKYCQCLKK